MNGRSLALAETGEGAGRADEALARDVARYRLLRERRRRRLPIRCERCGEYVGRYDPIDEGGEWFCHECKHHTERDQLRA